MIFYVFFFFNDTATTEIYTLSLHDALPILFQPPMAGVEDFFCASNRKARVRQGSEIQRRNACRPEPVREKRRFPNIARHQKARNSRRVLVPTAGLFPQISRERNWQAPTDSPNHTRSCRSPDRFPYKCGNPGDAHRAATAVPVPSADRAKNALVL